MVIEFCKEHFIEQDADLAVKKPCEQSTPFLGLFKLFDIEIEISISIEPFSLASRGLETVSNSLPSSTGTDWV